MTQEEMESAINWTDEQQERLAGHFKKRLEKICPEWFPGSDFPKPEIHIIIELPLDLDRCGRARWISCRLDDGRWWFGNFQIELQTQSLSYSQIFRTAIHEAAHTVVWCNRLRRCGYDFIKFNNGPEYPSHGKQFKQTDRELLRRAQELGWRKRRVVPNEVADLFNRHGGSRISLSSTAYSKRGML